MAQSLAPFAELRGNLRGPLALALTPLTLVLGVNQSWKTSVVDTLRVALLGTSADLEIGNQPHALIKLATPPGRPLTAEAHSRTGNAVFTLKHGGDRAKPVYDGQLASLSDAERARIFLLDDIGPMLKPGSKLAREAFLRAFGTLKDVPTPLGLTDDQHKLWIAAQEAVQKNGALAPIDVLAGITGWARSAQLAATKAANALEEQLERLKAAPAGDHLPTERLPEFERLLDDHKKYDAAARDVSTLATEQANKITYETTLRQVDADAAVLAAMEPQLEALETRRAACHKADLDAKAKSAQAHLIIARAEGLLGAFQHAVTTAGSAHAVDCFACGRAGADPKIYALRAAAIDKGLTARRDVAVTDDAAAAQADADLAAAESALNTLRGEHVQLRARVERQRSECTRLLAETLQAIETLTKRIPKRPATTMTRDQLEKRILDIKSAANVGKTLEEAARAMRAKRREAEDIAVLGKEAALMQSKLVAEAKDAALAAINARMPKDLVAGLDFTDAGLVWSVQPQAISGPGAPAVYGAASGREWGSLLVAVGAALEPPPLRILTMDDERLGRWDKANTRALMTVIGEAQAAGQITQAILVWNRPEEFAESVPEGWQVVARQPRI